MIPTTTLVIEHNVAQLTLNRPEKHNAFDDQIICELLEHLDTVKQDATLRALVLSAKGKNFCAGADLSWMKRMAKLTYDENLADAKNLALLMSTLNSLPIPTIARVQGAAYGGAIGLIACCDIAIASSNARFCLSEVKLGLAPATIGPFVIDAIGARRCRQLFVTAEVFDANQACDYGLLHQFVMLEELDSAVNAKLEAIKQSGPEAVKAAKQLIKQLARGVEEPAQMTSELIARLRVSPEGQEGLGAFFDQRKPSWQSH